MGHRFNDNHVGVYVDGWWGQYGPARAVMLAVDLGWQPEDQAAVVAHALTKLAGGRYVDLDEANSARRHAGLPPLASAYDEIDADQLDTEVEFALDDAVDWLNMETPDGLSWGWEDGDFVLRSAEDDQ